MSLSDKDLEKMADELFYKIDSAIRTWLPDGDLMTKDWIKKSLRTVRDAKVQLPSEQIVETEAIARFGNPTLDSELGIHWCRYKDAFHQGVNWLRSQIKPVQPISDQELHKVCKKIAMKQWVRLVQGVETERGWDTDPDMYDAAKEAYRVAEARILGGMK